MRKQGRKARGKKKGEGIACGKERMREEEEYNLYKEQYPFDEYYHFKEDFKCK